MSQTDDWSPDVPLGTEVFEQDDEAIAERARLDPDTLEAIEQDPALDPSRVVDERELEQAGVELDDPESEAVLDGGMDDPDGMGGPSDREQARLADDEGWDLDTEAPAG